MSFRPLPPLPDLEISEESIVKAADAMQMLINSALSIASDIAIGRNLKLFIKVWCYCFDSMTFFTHPQDIIVIYFYWIQMVLHFL